jgi:hypothetical protein
MAIPALPDRHCPEAWKRGQFLPAPARTWLIAGFPGFSVDEAGTVYREAYTDRKGSRRPRRALRSRSLAGTSHYKLFRDGFPVSISQKKLRKLLRLA